MPTNLFKYLVVLLCGISVFSSYSQDLEKATQDKLMKVNGGLSLSTVFYDANGIEKRRDPFYWQVNANMTFKFAGGITMPFSATFTQQQRDFTQPFNQIGFSPTYKGYTAHVGYRSMQFSPYTLGGMVFLGGGFEIKPKDSWIQVSGLYGRFARAVQEGGNDGTIVGIPTYERWGYGSKIRIGSDKNNFAVSFFRGRDDENSITVDTTTSDLRPGENLVWSLYTKHKIKKKLTFDFEYAFSGYTQDVTNEQRVLDNFNYYNNLGGIFTPNATTQYNKAIVTNLGYNAKAYNAKLTYKRIDPEYQSMGTPFLNNDLENLTLALSWKMFKKLLNVTATGGVQRNNLDELKTSRETRLATGVNVSYIYKKKLNLSLNYSNFSSNVRQVQFVQVDSLEFFQVTNNVNFRANYKLGSSKKVKKDIIFSTNFQKADDANDNETVIVNNNLGYKHQVKPLGLSVMLSMNYNFSDFQGLNTDTYGPSLNVSKSLLKKKVILRLMYSNLYRRANSLRQNRITNYRLQAKYNLSRHHSFSLNGTVLDRKTFEGTQPSFTEQTLTLQYAARF